MIPGSVPSNLVQLAPQARQVAHACREHQEAWSQRGVHKGQSVAVAASGQSRAAALKDTRNANVSDVHGAKPLSQRRVKAEGAVTVMAPGQIAQLAPMMGVSKAQLAQATRQILTGKGVGQAGGGRSSGRTSAAARMLAYHAALNALDATDAGMRAMLLSPVGEPGDSTEDQARRFQEADDPEALEKLLKPLRELGIALPAKEVLWEQLLWVRHQPGQLMQWLDQKLAVPLAGDEGDARQRIVDGLQSFSVDEGEGQRTARDIRAYTNVQGVAGQTDNPAGFSATYVQVLDRLDQPEETNHATLLLNLLNTCQFEELNPTLSQLTTAVAADVNSIEPSRDTGLHKLMGDLGEMRLSNTTVSQMNTLVQQLNRTVFRDTEQKANPTLMLREMLTLIVRPATDARSYLRYPEKLGITDVTTSIVLLSGIGRIVGGMHPKCFPNEQVWMDIRDALVDALNELTVQEEDAAQQDEARQQVH